VHLKYARGGLHNPRRGGHSEHDTRGRHAVRGTGVRWGARQALHGRRDARPARERAVPGGVSRPRRRRHCGVIWLTFLFPFSYLRIYRTHFLFVYIRSAGLLDANEPNWRP
jgi:hypothetical protein